MRRSAIRLLAAADAVGGVWTYSLDLARALAPLGVETVLALFGPGPDAAQRRAAAQVPGLKLVETGLELDWMAKDEAAVAEAGAALSRLARQSAADLVQLNMPALGAGQAFGVPTIAVQHSCVATWWQAVRGGPLPPELAWRSDLAREGLLAADLVVAPSAAFAEATRRTHGLAEAPRTVHNGRSPLPLPSQAPHDFVFTAGRLWDAGKDAATLDAAAAKLAVPFHAAGPVEGPNGERVAFENLHCLGTLDPAALGRWLSARPVFASAARYEPFGLAVLEAAMAGCPLVLADIPTFRELWGDAALFVPPGDADGFARTLGALVGDDFERAVMGRAARERARRYTPEAMAAQMAALYRDLLPQVSRPALAAAASAAA